MKKLFLVLLFLSCGVFANDIDDASMAQDLQYAWNQINTTEPASERLRLFRNFIHYAKRQLPNVSPSERRDIRSLIMRARAQVSSQGNNNLIRSLFQPDRMETVDPRKLGG
ncbi:MAG: hypothetical protein WD055_01090 [Candidatus Dependentiae bacterium]